MKYIFLVFLLAAYGCGSGAGNASHTAAATGTASDSATPVQQGSLLSSIDSGTNRQVVFDYTGYNTSSGNPDTSLAIFIYQDYKNYVFDNQREQYIRIHLENEKIMKLVRDLFYDRVDYKECIQALHNNRERFLQDTRSVVEGEYKTYHAVCGTMEMDYLCQIKDSWMKDLFAKMLEDAAVKEEEKGEIRNAIKDYW